MSIIFSFEFLPITILTLACGAVAVKFYGRWAKAGIVLLSISLFSFGVFVEYKCNRSIDNIFAGMFRGDPLCQISATSTLAPEDIASSATSSDQRLINGGTIDGFRMPLDLNNRENIDELIEALGKNENGRISLDAMIYENSVNETITSNFYGTQGPEGEEIMVSYGLCGRTSQYYCHLLVFTNQEVFRRYIQRTSFGAVRISGHFHVGTFSEPLPDINLTYAGFDGAVSKIFIRAVEP